MPSQKQYNRGMVLVAVIAVVAVIAGMAISGGGLFSATGGSGSAGSPTGQVGSAGLSCPDSGQSTLSITQYNPLNTTGSESYDQTAYLYKVQQDGTEALFATLSDTTAGEQTLNCGDSYRLRLASSDDKNARIDNLRSGEGASVSSDGRFVEFQAQGAVYNLEIDSAQRGDLKVKAFDVDNNGFVYDDSDATANDYETSGVTFQSTTDNSTATALGTGEDLNWRFDIEANGGDVDANDFGLYMLVEADTTEYEEPSVSFEGADLSDVTGELDQFESRAFNSYEFVYRIDSSIEDSDKTIEFVISALDDVDPSTDLSIDFVGIGAVKETSGNAMRYASATDASSPQSVFTKQTFGINIS